MTGPLICKLLPVSAQKHAHYSEINGGIIQRSENWAVLHNTVLHNTVLCCTKPAVLISVPTECEKIKRQRK
jgi:hypothetical protein